MLGRILTSSTAMLFSDNMIGRRNEMKKLYENPKAQLIIADFKDIITLSMNEAGLGDFDGWTDLVTPNDPAK